jgi:hypothetical protein
MQGERKKGKANEKGAPRLLFSVQPENPRFVPFLDVRAARHTTPFFCFGFELCSCLWAALSIDEASERKQLGEESIGRFDPAKRRKHPHMMALTIVVAAIVLGGPSGANAVVTFSENRVISQNTAKVAVTGNAIPWTAAKVMQLIAPILFQNPPRFGHVLAVFNCDFQAA